MRYLKYLGIVALTVLCTNCIDIILCLISTRTYHISFNGIVFPIIVGAIIVYALINKKDRVKILTKDEDEYYTEEDEEFQDSINEEALEFEGSEDLEYTDDDNSSNYEACDNSTVKRKK